MGDHKINPFARGNRIGALPVKVADAFGRELQVGDEVIAHKLQAPTFAIQEITPVLELGAPPNTVRVVFTCAMVVQTQALAALPGVIRVRTAAERGQPEVADDTAPAMPISEN